MPRAPSARRYAQAVFQIALERNELEAWLEDLQLLGQALEDQSFAAFMEAPQVRLANKLQAIQEVFSATRPLARNLVSLLASRGATSLLPAILEQYQGFLDAHRGIERADVVTAVPLEDGQRQKVADLLKSLVGKEIRLTTRLEPLIIGGILAKVGDRLIDGSTRTRLQEMRRSLIQVPS